MNTQIAVRIGVAALALLVISLLWNFFKGAGDGVKLVIVILLGTAGGLLAVKYLVPMLGDALGESIFSSGEQVEQDEMTKAAASIAQGDYQGAIEHYEKMLEDKPDDPFPVAEIAKVYAERLRDPRAALKALEDHLQSREWPVDDAAFIMFRIADVHLTHLHDFETARDMLEQIVGNFPNTRHSANAHHRISDIEQLQYKQLVEQRARSAAAAAAKS
jgi:tetratricopeptide (TPR) repeat protein